MLTERRGDSYRDRRLGKVRRRGWPEHQASGPHKTPEDSLSPVIWVVGFVCFLGMPSYRKGQMHSALTGESMHLSAPPR